MNQADEISLFQKVLEVRTLFKSVSQISWNISKLEKRFSNLDDLDKDELRALYGVYKENLIWLRNTLAEYEGN